MIAYCITQEQLDVTPERDRQWRWPGVKGPGEYRWNEAQNCYEPIRAQAEEQPHDFDKGFGIGGLGRHVEDPLIPTVAQIERLEQMEAQATYCRRCGQSDEFDGAMFTTIAGSGLCDDCV